MTDSFLVTSRQDTSYMPQGLERLLQKFLGRCNVEKSLIDMGYSSHQLTALKASDRLTLSSKIVAVFKQFAEQYGYLEGWLFTERWLGLNGIAPVTLICLGIESQLSPTQVAYRIEQSLRALRRPFVRTEIAVRITHTIYTTIGLPESQVEARMFFE